MLEHILNDLAEGPTEPGEICPDPKLLEGAIQVVMSGEATSSQIGALLMGLRCRGEKPEHLKAVVDVMLSHATAFPNAGSHDVLLDTCGPGGVGRSTVNISTATALMSAAGGVKVAKHGNRSVSSKAGSADTLEALGIKIDCAPELSAKSLEETNFCFLFAPLYHPAMKHAGPVRKEVKFRSIFNLAGPLSNPALPTYQLVGVGRRALMRPYIETLKLLGRKRAMVVHGRNGLDEISLAQVTEGYLLQENGEIESITFSPSDFDVDMIDMADLVIDSPQDSANKIREYLGGKTGPIADEINANVAAVLLLAGKAETIGQGFMMAREIQSSGAGAKLLERVVQITNG